MSTSAISSSVSALLTGPSYYDPPSKKSAFDQLGTDLQSGNLSAAQSDFAAMTGDPSNSTYTPTTTSTNPVVQDIVTLSTDLKSGNLAAAKQDYTTLKTDLKTELSLVATSATASNEDTETKSLLKLVQSFTTPPSTAIAAYASNSGSTSTSSTSDSSNTSSNSSTSSSSTSSSSTSSRSTSSTSAA
jgi:hypothetical protein